MRKRYDFSKARPNPYAKLLKRPVTIRLDAATVEYFKALAKESDIPYQTLINQILRREFVPEAGEGQISHGKLMEQLQRLQERIDALERKQGAA